MGRDNGAIVCLRETVDERIIKMNREQLGAAVMAAFGIMKLIEGIA